MSQNYGQYQAEIYGRAAMTGRLPVVTTDTTQLQAEAKKVLNSKAYNYIAAGAGEHATMDANRLAFRQWKLIPRMMRSIAGQDVSVELFGVKYPTPVVMGPVGVQGIFHEDGDTSTASVCQELGIPFSMSSASTSSIEQIAEANKDGKRWFQLYWPHDDDVTISILNRAKKNGFSVLLVTLDTFQIAWRPADLDGGYVPFIKGIGNQIAFSDPCFREKFQKATGKTVEEDIVGASQFWLKSTFSGPHTWEKIAFLRKHWDGPIVLKGIQHVEDAKLAVEYGCDGIVVSNHGGRQLDGAIGSLEMLPEIVEAVGDKTTVLFDSGIRTGVDILKALCLGAKAVLVARPVIYGLSIGGKHGVKEVLQGFLADFYQSMGLAGIRTIADCTPDMVRKVSYPGDYRASN